jgi:hypothetical protein
MGAAEAENQSRTHPPRENGEPKKAPVHPDE